MDDDWGWNQLKNYRHVWLRLIKRMNKPSRNSSELRYWKKYYSKTKRYLWKH